MFQTHYHERNHSDLGSLEVPYTSGDPGFIEHGPSTVNRSLTPMDVESKFVVDEGNEWDAQTPIQHPVPPTSSMSYYSASDIPPPSPMPEQHIYSPRSPPSMNMSSVEPTPVAFNYGTSLQPQPRSQYSSPRHTPPAASSSRSPPRSPPPTSYSGAYEMRVRSPTRNPGMERAQSNVSHISEASENSFVTAQEGSIDHGHNYQPHRQSQESDAPTVRGLATGEYRHDPWRESAQSEASQYTVSGPHAL